MQEFRNVLERGKPKTMEFRIIRADVIPHPIEINVSLLKNEQGEVLSFIGVIRDIAERKRLEKEVLIRQEAIESSIGPILLADMDGKVTHANFAFLNLFGYSSEQKVLEQSIESLWKKEKPSEKIIETVQNEGVWRGERLGHDLKGNEFSLDVQIPLILDTSDDPIGLVCFLYDITLRKETEIKMRETSKMAALGEFVSGTAHEINNPIGIISGNAQYLLAKLDYDSLRKMGIQ
jgi:PAS domain S-box-containing protein